jgi:hypothetical protein
LRKRAPFSVLHYFQHQLPGIGNEGPQFFRIVFGKYFPESTDEPEAASVKIFSVFPIRIHGIFRSIHFFEHFLLIFDNQCQQNMRLGLFAK